MERFEDFAIMGINATRSIFTLYRADCINGKEATNYIDAIAKQNASEALNVNAIAAIVEAYPEAFRTIRRDAEKLDIYHDKDTAEYFKHVFAELNILLFANSVQRGAIDGGAYYILEDGAIIRVYVDGAFPRFA